MNKDTVNYSKLKQCNQCDQILQDLQSDNDDNYRGWCGGCHIVWLLPRPKFQIEECPPSCKGDDS